MGLGAKLTKTVWPEPPPSSMLPSILQPVASSSPADHLATKFGAIGAERNNQNNTKSILSPKPIDNDAQ